jgi:hypothetical protein
VAFLLTVHQLSDIIVTKTNRNLAKFAMRNSQCAIAVSPFGDDDNEASPQSPWSRGESADWGLMFVKQTRRLSRCAVWKASFKIRRRQPTQQLRIAHCHLRILIYLSSTNSK